VSFLCSIYPAKPSEVLPCRIGKENQPPPFLPLACVDTILARTSGSWLRGLSFDTFLQHLSVQVESKHHSIFYVFNLKALLFTVSLLPVDIRVKIFHHDHLLTRCFRHLGHTRHTSAHISILPEATQATSYVHNLYSATKAQLHHPQYQVAQSNFGSSNSITKIPLLLPTAKAIRSALVFTTATRQELHYYHSNTVNATTSAAPKKYYLRRHYR